MYVYTKLHVRYLFIQGRILQYENHNKLFKIKNKVYKAVILIEQEQTLKMCFMTLYVYIYIYIYTYIYRCVCLYVLCLYIYTNIFVDCIECQIEIIDAISMKG